MEDILKNISMEDLEKLKMLLSIIPGNDQKEIVTLRVFRDEYLNLIKNNRSKSYYNSVNIALNHLTDYFSQRDGKPGIQHSIGAIRFKDVEDFISHLQQKVSKGYVVYYRNLKAAFNKAKDWGYVKENYFTKVKLPKRQKMAPVFINSDQLEVISRQLATRQTNGGQVGNGENGVVKDVVVFAFYTGMRLDEIVNLRWKNVDLENKVITVGDEEFTTKGRTQRFIPMSEEAYEALLRVKNPSAMLEINSERRVKSKTIYNLSLVSARDFVFCKEDGSKFTGNYFSRRFKSACKAAGMDNAIHFHTLRHSFASSLAQKGVPLYTIKELLGHSSISTTEIYSHLNIDCLREAVEKLDTSTTLSAGTSTVRQSSLQASPGTGARGKKPQIFSINSGEKR